MSTKPWVRNLGLKIWQRRRETDASLRAISEELGVSPSTLSRIERGAVEPDTDTVVRICKWLGVSPNSLLAGEVLAESTPAEGDLSTPDMIEVHLRADRALPTTAANAIAAMVRAAYKELAKNTKED